MQEEQDQEDFVIPRRSDADFSTFIYQLNTADIIDDLRHTLKGEVYDSQKQSWIKKEGVTQRINSKGIADITSTASMIVNKNTILSDISEQQIGVLMQEFHQNLAQLFFLNYEEYGLEKKQLTVVLYMVLGFMFAGLKRAQGGSTRTALTKMHQVLERIEKKPEKRGIGLPFFGKGD